MGVEKYLVSLKESIVNLDFDAVVKVAQEAMEVDVLKDLIARTPIDIIEALHPPPMGDLPIGEALSLWKDKVIWMGFPGSVYVLGPEATKKHTLNLLKEVIPGDRLCIEVSTENLVSNENLLMLTSILENADLPLTQEKIDRIERSLG